MQVETFVETPVQVGMGKIVAPKVLKSTLERLRVELPEMRIRGVEESSFTRCSVEIVMKALPTCHDGRADRLRFQAKVAAEMEARRDRKGVAGYSHAKWLFENRPGPFMDLLRGGIGVEVCGTVLKCQTVRDVETSHGKVQPVPLLRHLIPFFPRIGRDNLLRMIWIPIGSGDMDPRTRVAFVIPNR